MVSRLFVVVSLSLSVYLQCVWWRVVRPDCGEGFLHGERCQYAYQTSTRCCKLPPQYGHRTQRSKGEWNTLTFTVLLWFDMFDFNMSAFSLFSQRICSISTLKMSQRSWLVISVCLRWRGQVMSCPQPVERQDTWVRV